MPSATAFERLAPDQRAAVELVLRQGRSYGELADLLGMPEETIRARARNGVAALAPDLPSPGRAGEICDWLLGQQSEAHAARTRALLEADPAAKRWAETVAGPLREAPGGEAVPHLGERGRNGAAVRLDKGAGKAEPAGAGSAASTVGASGASGTAGARGTAASGGADRSGAAGASGAADSAGEARGAGLRGAPGDPAPNRDAPRGRSSRLGGALVIGASALLVAVVLVFVLTRGGDDSDPTAETAAPPAATATATATPAPGANDILLKGPAGSKAVGLMRLFQANDGTVRFAVAAQGVAPNEGKQTYSLWFTGEDGKAQLLGDVKDPVGKSGELTSAGPGNDDVDEFPQWFTEYDTIVVTLDEPDAKEPGKVILSGDLPNAG